MSKGQRSRSPWPRKGKFQNGHKIRILQHTTMKIHILMHLDKFYICLTILGSKVKVILTLVMQNFIIDHKIWMFSPETLKLHILMHQSYRALPATPFLGQRSRSWVKGQGHSDLAYMQHLNIVYKNLNAFTFNLETSWCIRWALLTTPILVKRSRSPWKFLNGHKNRILSPTAIKLHILLHLHELY